MNAETLLFADTPRWVVMWLLAGGLFFAGKAAMLRGADLRGWRLFAFTCLWPGMDPAPFRVPQAAVRPGIPHRATLAGPLINVLFGAVLLWLVTRHLPQPLAAGWVGMIGLIFLLHFGVFGLLAWAWNALGIPVVPIMRCPVAATSLGEFWGRRWNLAFRDLAHRLVFTPVCRQFGHAAALWVSFIASCLAHELVISVPAGAGYGLPSVYFLLQALGITLERRGLRGRHWFFTHAFTALPACIAFHPPFVERVMTPFFQTIGALP